MKRINTQQGMTLVELLIGMTMSALIFLVSTSLVAALFTSNTKQKYRESLEQVKNDLTSEFSTNVRWGKVITRTDSEITIDGKNYHISDKRIYKGSDPITPKEVEIDSFQIRDYSTTEDEVSVEITISMQHKVYASAQDVLRVVVSQRKFELAQDDE